jgi:hypothetical protein
MIFVKDFFDFFDFLRIIILKKKLENFRIYKNVLEFLKDF